METHSGSDSPEQAVTLPRVEEAPTTSRTEALSNAKPRHVPQGTMSRSSSVQITDFRSDDEDTGCQEDWHVLPGTIPRPLRNPSDPVPSLPDAASRRTQGSWSTEMTDASDANDPLHLSDVEGSKPLPTWGSGTIHERTDDSSSRFGSLETVESAPLIQGSEPSTSSAMFERSHSNTSQPLFRDSVDFYKGSMRKKRAARAVRFQDEGEESRHARLSTKDDALSHASSKKSLIPKSPHTSKFSYRNLAMLSGMSIGSDSTRRSRMSTMPAWFDETPGVAKILSMDPGTPEFRRAWTSLKESYSQRHSIEVNSDFQQETAIFAKRLKARVVQTINPSKSPYLRYWDALIILLIAITLVLQPYEVAFALPPGFGILNHIMDVVFLADFLLQFNIAYYDSLMAKLVTNKWRIAINYLKTYFLVDMVASLPYQLMMYSTSAPDLLASSHPEDLTGWETALMMVPLLRMFRMARVSRIVHRFESLFSIDHGMLSIATFGVQTAMLAHFTACLWGLVPVLQRVTHEEHEILGVHENYSYCLYFAVKTLTSVGYGDISPVTTFERWLSMLFMLLGAYFFGYVIGSITNTVSIRNHTQNHFYETMDKLQAFVEEHQVQKDLRTRLRSYFFYRYQSDAGAGVSWNEIFDLMSPSLKQQVAKNTCAKWISDVSYFKGCEEDFIIRLSLSLHPETYTPREKLISLGEPSNRMYVVRQGVVASEGRISISGGVIGLDMLTNLYINSTMTRNFESIALTFSNVMRCDREDVLEVLDKFPNTSATLRRTIIRHVFKLEVRSYSRAVVRLLTGRRSVHARFQGDPSGREEHYYQKLLVMSPDRNPASVRHLLDSALSKAASAEPADSSDRSQQPTTAEQNRRSRRKNYHLHRANELDPGMQFQGQIVSMDDLPDLVMNSVRALGQQLDDLHAQLRLRDRPKLRNENVSSPTREPQVTGLFTRSATIKEKRPSLSRMPSLPYRPYEV
mmetsp:Transcript_6392/g.17875  ORF Transcript_6392/g.17875 Transcript_6392/m.17875 type:complete len:971 (-) Transcript_6392:1209-4121(-)